MANNSNVTTAPAPDLRIIRIRPTSRLHFVIVTDSPLYSEKAGTLRVRPNDSLPYHRNQCSKS
jgi:hypothetical protein